MTLLLVIIAIPGIAAVLLRWWAALLETTRHSLDRLIAGEIGDTRATRGDISGMGEAEDYRRQARSRQRRGALRLLLWSCALIVPLVLPATFPVYALYGLLWFVPERQRADEES